MSLLASLAFVIAALAVFGALRSTIARFRDAAVANIVAMRDCNELREFRIQAVSVLVRPAVTNPVRRGTPRAPVRRIKAAEGLRAAA